MDDTCGWADDTGTDLGMTAGQHRSQGVGRALMHAVLRHFEDLPVTLTASRSGRPLYEKLGFTTLGDANWWR